MSLSCYLNFIVVYFCSQRVHTLIETFKLLSHKVGIITERWRRQFFEKVHMYKESQPSDWLESMVWCGAEE